MLCPLKPLRDIILAERFQQLRDLVKMLLGGSHLRVVEEQCSDEEVEVDAAVKTVQTKIDHPKNVRQVNIRMDGVGNTWCLVW